MGFFSFYVFVYFSSWRPLEKCQDPWGPHGGVFRHIRTSNPLRFDKIVSSQIVQSPHVVKMFGWGSTKFLKNLFVYLNANHMGLVLVRSTSFHYWNFIYVPKNPQVLGNDDKISSFGRAFLLIISPLARACQAKDLQEKSPLRPSSLYYLLLQQRLKLNDAAWALRSCCSPSCLASLKWQKVIRGLPCHSSMLKTCQLPQSHCYH